MPWHTKTLSQTCRELKTSAEGLSSAEAGSRLKDYGPNRLQVKGDSLWKILFEPFRSIFTVVLLAAAIVSLLSRELLDAGIIVVILLINALIYYIQHYAAQRVLRSLRRFTVRNVRVLRDGDVLNVSSEQLVPGDVILLSEGEQIPADARVLKPDNLQTNEASLTGESLPIAKHAAKLALNTPIYERHIMLYQGTYITSG